jgi:three-Cys-motif partner protein
MSISEHEFGGISTNLKLSVVEGYLRAFTIALRPRFGELWYIDAFAGTGERTERLEAHDETLFDPATPERIERHRGSARIAIEIEPHFDRLIFIEKNPKHCSALQALKDSHPGRFIEIREGAADTEIRTILAKRDWTSTRAVMFLDPYGMSVPWETLEEIQGTQAIDVWYLVSLAGLFRQAALDRQALDASKRAAITRIVGTDSWEDEWYTKSTRRDLFGEIDEQSSRIADVGVIETYVQKRLETLFPKVLKPLGLLNARNAPMFSLFFAISNPEPKAIGLATRIAGHMLKVGSSSQVRPR